MFVREELLVNKLWGKKLVKPSWLDRKKLVGPEKIGQTKLVTNTSVKADHLALSILVRIVHDGTLHSNFDRLQTTYYNCCINSPIFHPL